MTEIKFNGEVIEKLTADFIRVNIKKEGIFEGTYNCPADKEKADLREQLGVKYLDWRWKKDYKEKFYKKFTINLMSNII